MIRLVMPEHINTSVSSLWLCIRMLPASKAIASELVVLSLNAPIATSKVMMCQPVFISGVGVYLLYRLWHALESSSSSRYHSSQ